MTSFGFAAAVVLAASIALTAAALAQNESKGASSNAPGQKQKAAGGAKAYAPGQRQKSPGDAKIYAPGQQPKKETKNTR